MGKSAALPYLALLDRLPACKDAACHQTICLHVRHFEKIISGSYKPRFFVAHKQFHLIQAGLQIQLARCDKPLLERRFVSLLLEVEVQVIGALVNRFSVYVKYISDLLDHSLTLVLYFSEGEPAHVYVKHDVYDGFAFWAINVEWGELEIYVTPNERRRYCFHSFRNLRVEAGS